MNSARDKMQEPAPAAAAPRAAALAALVERTLAGMGYELVELERAGGGLLRVTLDLAPGEMPAGEAADDADAAGERHIGIEDCERVSRHLTHLFAVEDVDYDRLEVSSPGLDRPLRGERDFTRFAGEMAKVQLFSATEGRRRLRGQLLGVVQPAGAADASAGGGLQMALAADSGPGPGIGPRVRMLLLPEAPPPPARGARRQRARKAVPAEVIEFALADVEKARLAPEWEFDRNAIARTAQQDPQISD